MLQNQSLTKSVCTCIWIRWEYWWYISPLCDISSALRLKSIHPSFLEQFSVLCCSVKWIDVPYITSAQKYSFNRTWFIILSIYLTSYQCQNSLLNHKFSSIKPVLASELLMFWTLSIVRYSRNWKTQRFWNWIYFSKRCVFYFLAYRTTNEVQNSVIIL
jgi:hypothetical protein